MKSFRSSYRWRPFSFITILVILSLLLGYFLSTSTAMASRTSNPNRSRHTEADRGDSSRRASSSSKGYSKSSSGDKTGGTKSGGGNKKSGKLPDLPANFYERLGISKKATDKEIKKAYRKLAIKVCIWSKSILLCIFC